MIFFGFAESYGAVQGGAEFVCFLFNTVQRGVAWFTLVRCGTVLLGKTEQSCRFPI